MIIVLEGVRGTGKTEAAKRLSERYNAPIVRPFRPTLAHHHSGDSTVEQELKALGVPVNTYVEDMYVADILSTIIQHTPSAHFVLDRSMGSAIAHRSCPEDDGAVLRVWQRLLSRAQAARYVWLRVPYAVACQRVAGRPMPSQGEYAALDNRFSRVYEGLTVPKFKLVTADIAVDGVVSAIGSWLDGVGRG